MELLMCGTRLLHSHPTCAQAHLLTAIRRFATVCGQGQQLAQVQQGGQRVARGSWSVKRSPASSDFASVEPMMPNRNLASA